MFMTIDDVQKLLPKKLEPIMEIYGFSYDQAIAIMRYFHWNEEKMQQKWFDN